MISFVTGAVQHSAAGVVVIEVGGFGVEVVPTARCSAALRPGQRATVATCLVVREDNWTLYGFADSDERACFQTLQHAKGVGPRVALNLLGALTPDQLRSAVAAGDSAALTAAPGIGTKGAQRLVIDLRDRLGPVTGGSAPPVPPGTAGDGSPDGSGWRRDVSMALVGLGWTGADAAAAVQAVAPQAAVDGAGTGPDGSPDVGRLLRLALQSLDRGARP